MTSQAVWGLPTTRSGIRPRSSSATRSCARRIRPTRITPPTNPLTGSDQSFYAVESACVNLALFATIAKAAGKNLTFSSFAHAGYELRNAAIPGSGAPVSFGPGRAYATRPGVPGHL